jgi:hypothetical protein
MSGCDHELFYIEADVTRLTDAEGGPVTGFTTDIRVICDGCKEPFVWLGLEAGSHPSEPRISIDGKTLRAPIAPAVGHLSPLDKIGRAMGEPPPGET